MKPNILESQYHNILIFIFVIVVLKYYFPPLSVWQCELGELSWVCLGANVLGHTP